MNEGVGMSRLARVLVILSITALSPFIFRGTATQASFPGMNGKIAFATDLSSKELSTSEVYVVNPTGGAVRRITGHSGESFQPVYSPGGSQIAFGAQKRYGDSWARQLWAMNTDGTNKRVLTRDRDLSIFSDAGFEWSPDGTKIAFVDHVPEHPGGEDRMGNIWIIDADGTDARQLTDTHETESDPDWSPDGTQIAYTRAFDDEGLYGVWVMNADGSGQRKLANEPFNALDPSWSPEGTRIAFSRDAHDDADRFYTDIFVMNADGSGVTNLTNTDWPHEYQPVWSPDGTKIAFATGKLMQSGDPSGVWTMDASGAHRDQIVSVEYGLQEIEGLSWQPLRPPSDITLRVLERDGRIKIAGSVAPVHPGGNVIVTLSLRRAPGYVVSKGVIRQLSVVSRYSATFQKPRRGTCRITVSYVGDLNHGGDDRSRTFKC